MLFVLNSLSVGGSELKVIRVANALARLGERVGLAYLNPPEDMRHLIHSEIKVSNLQRRGKYSFRSLHRLYGAIHEEFDTTIAVNLYPLLYVVPAAKWKRASRVRTVGLVNTSEALGKDRLLRSVFVPFLRRCDQVVFGCQLQRSQWIERHGIGADQSRVIYNGVDESKFTPTSAREESHTLRHELSIPKTAVVIGSVGRLAPEKNFDAIINAVADLKDGGRDAYAVLVGDGGERAKLAQIAIERGLADRVKFLGQLADVRSAIAMMDVFVLPSRAVETFSNAALEAMAMGRAVVLSEMGGAAEMVEHGKSGMLFPPGNLAALARILMDLFDQPVRRQALGLEARERVLRHFRFQDMVIEYQRLLSGSTVPGRD